MAVAHRLVSLNWIEAVLSPIAVALMEVLWIYPWLLWAGTRPGLAVQRPPLSLLALIILLSSSIFVTRFFLSRKWSLNRVRLGIVCTGLVVIFLVFRLEYAEGFGLLSGKWFVHTANILLNSFSYLHPLLIGLAASFYLWWRGISRGRSSLQYEDVYPSFLVGLVALVLLVIVRRGDSGVSSSQGVTLGLCIAGFFFFGLLALALGNLQEMRERMLERQELTPIVNRRWLSLLLIVAGGIVLAGVGIASIFSPEMVTSLSRLLDIGYELLLRGVSYLLIPVSYLVAGLVYAVQFIVSLLRRLHILETSPQQEFPQFEPPTPPNIAEKLPAEALLAIKWILFAAVAVAVVIVLARAIFRYLSFREKTDIEETSESLWSWGGFAADLRLFLGMMRPHFQFRKGKRAIGSSIPGWYVSENIEDILDIREIYRRLLWVASAAGVGRLHFETPYEYARRLKGLIPEGSVPLDELAELYLSARYGDVQVGDKLLEQANHQWRVLLGLFKGFRETQATK